MSTRGVRNFNPGNIKDNDVPWKGLADPADRTGEQKDERTFCVFRGPWWGVRAIAVILRNYSRRHGLDTVAEIVNRWAPPSDSNPTSRYFRFVAGRLAVRSDEVIDVEDYETMKKLVRAIVYFENGLDPYEGSDAWIYDAGLLLADFEPPPGLIYQVAI